MITRYLMKVSSIKSVIECQVLSTGPWYRPRLFSSPMNRYPTLDKSKRHLEGGDRERGIFFSNVHQSQVQGISRLPFPYVLQPHRPLSTEKKQKRKKTDKNWKRTRTKRNTRYTPMFIFMWGASCGEKKRRKTAICVHWPRVWAIGL